MNASHKNAYLPGAADVDGLLAVVLLAEVSLVVEVLVLAGLLSVELSVFATSPVVLGSVLLLL
jgi:hypothetical protein